MRIAMMSWETLYSIPVGGVAAHVTELSAALARRGHEVHVYTRIASGQPKYSFIDGVHYHRCPHQLNRDFVTEINDMCNSFMWHLGESEAYMNKKFDIVHGHDWLAAKAVVQAKNLRGHRTVMTFHSTEYGRCGNRHYGGNSARVAGIEWEGSFVANRLIMVSEAMRRECNWLYKIPDWKGRTIYNGVHAEKFNGFVDQGKVKMNYGVGPLDPMVLFVGRLTAQKGPDLLLESVPHMLKHHRNAKFVFVGDGDMRPGLQHRTHQLGIGHAVRWVGYKSGGELIALFKAADLVCVPSRNEPFGIVILEAWSAGKAVVATKNGGPGEFVNHNYDGLSVSDTVDSIGWGVGTAVSNLGHARWMGQNGRREAESKFAWDTIAAQTEDVYRQA
jgi:glycosyltransferase involved in cell wall biosynthesis